MTEVREHLVDALGETTFLPEEEYAERGRRLPGSWTDHRHEPVEHANGEARWYALSIKTGVLTNLAKTEPAIQTLYVREDVERAFERALVAIRSGSGYVPKPDLWASSIGEDALAGSPIQDDDQRDRFSRLLEELYGVTPTSDLTTEDPVNGD